MTNSQGGDIRKKSSIWEKVNAISSAGLLIVGACALWFAYSQIKEAHEEAKVQHLVEAVQQFEQPPYSDRRRNLARARIDPDRKALRPLNVDSPPNEMVDLLDFYQHIGMLVDKGYLDPVDVYGEFSDPMFLLYTDAGPLIEARRKDQPAVWGAFVALIDTMERINNADNAGKGGPPFKEEEIFEEYNADAEFPSGEMLPSRASRSQPHRSSKNGMDRGQRQEASK